MNVLGEMMREWFDYLSSGYVNLRSTMTRRNS